MVKILFSRGLEPCALTVTSLGTLIFHCYNRVVCSPLQYHSTIFVFLRLVNAYLKLGAWHSKVNIFYSGNGRTWDNLLSCLMTAVMLTPTELG